MEKFYAIKVKLDNDTYSELIPVSALAENVIYNNDYNIKDILGTVDIEEDGSLQEQIKNINDKANIYTGLGTHTDGAISQDSSTGLFTNRPYVVIGTDFPIDSGFNESVLLFDTDDLADDVPIVIDSVNYINLTNKPSINNITLVGNKTLADFGLMEMTSQQMESVLNELEGSGG